MASKPDQWIARRLASPVSSGGPDGLRAAWRETRIVACCSLPTGAWPGPWLTYALRGAVGNVMFDMPAQAPGLPPPYLALFRPIHLQIGTRHVPAPVLFEAEPDGPTHVRFTVRLLGWAEIWRDAVIDALIEAVTSGMSIGENAHISRPYPLHDLVWSRHEGLAPPPTGLGRGRFDLWPLSPLCYGPIRHDPSTPERLVLAGLGRVKGLARWQDYDLALDLPSLPELCGQIDVAFNGRTSVERIEKHSRRHRTRTITLEGERTRLRIGGLGAKEAATLAIAGTIGAGGHTSWGFGRFQLNTL